MQLHSFERRNSYIFFAIPIQTHELFFAPPGIFSGEYYEFKPLILYLGALYTVVYIIA